MLRSRAICAALLVAKTSQAGGLVVGSGSPRAIGRAGAGTVGDDGAGALLVNPAAMARREGWRGQLGLAFTDDEISFQAGDAPKSRNQSGSDFAPTGAAITSVGSWVIGLGAMTASVTDRAMRPLDLDASELDNDFEFRYAGIAGAFQRDTITLGAARRLGDNFAVGLALGASRVQISERRRVWAGFGGRDVLGDPVVDVELAVSGTDWFVPSAVAGVMFVPDEAPLELGASIAWMQAVDLDGSVTASADTDPKAPRIRTSNDPRGSIRMRQPLTVRAGARYIHERFVAEVGGDVWIAPRALSQIDWEVSGVRVVDRSGVEKSIVRVPSRISMRTHGAIRAALDYELINGFLWATTGYAFQVAGVAETRQSPSFGDLGGHTAAVGLEATGGGFTLTLGWSRTWSSTSTPASALVLDNPFNAGTKAVPTATYDGSIDQIGVLLDVEIEPPI